MTKEKNSKKLPSLDGWRAVSIALVLLAHSSYTSGFPEVFHHGAAGGLGVRLFFIISGFLITCLLLQEQMKHGTISLKHFYVRRALRILPVYFFYLLVLGGLTRYSQPVTAWLANLTFTTNFFPTPWFTGHLWSLGVEEQFYLLWPWFLVAVLGRPGSRSTLLKIIAVPLLLAPVVRMMDYKHWYPESAGFLFQDFSFFARFDSLAFGCLAAVFFVHSRPVLEAFYQKNTRLIAGGGMTLLFVPTLLKSLHMGQDFQAAGTYSLQALGFSLLLLQSIFHPDRGLYRFLNWKWVSHIGVLSYSIYIWQQLFCVPDDPLSLFYRGGLAGPAFGPKDAWWVSFPGCILAALLAAHASYYLLEKPLLGLRARFR